MSRASAERTARVLRQELSRAQRSMHYEGYPRAFYVSYLVRDETTLTLEGRFGALVEDNEKKRRDCLADVRVGSYRYDQVQEGGLHDNNREDESYGYVEMPIGGSTDGLKHTLWRLTEARYREALDAYLRKKSVELTYRSAHPHLASFERRDGGTDVRWRALPRVDRARLRKLVLAASAYVKSYPRIKSSSVKLVGRDTVRTFVSSEGATRVQCDGHWAIELYLWYLADDGESFPISKSIFVSSPKELPSLATLKAEIRRLHDRLAALAKAPTIRSFSGPVLLDPRPAGLLVHEAIGHRLEGNRLLSSGEGQTFRDSVGQQILPRGFDVWDDPRMRRFGKRSCVGSYDFDDEGVEAERADLVRDGELVGFLTSRAPIGKKHASNGHGRSRYHARAISRMGVTVLEHRNGLSDEELRGAFIEEIRRQGVPYGIRIVDASGGETTTDAYDFQAFLGQIDFATRVHPDGREEPIRGVDFVGTPLNAVRNVLAAGRQKEIDNAWCGAESGEVPVTTISPALLVKELELQHKHSRPYTPFAYPMPWERRRKK
jgi:predicted Zn-dependent protease